MLILLWFFSTFVLRRPAYAQIIHVTHSNALGSLNWCSLKGERHFLPDTFTAFTTLFSAPARHASLLSVTLQLFLLLVFSIIPSIHSHIPPSIHHHAVERLWNQADPGSNLVIPLTSSESLGRTLNIWGIIKIGTNSELLNSATNYKENTQRGVCHTVNSWQMLIHFLFNIKGSWKKSVLHAFFQLFHIHPFVCLNNNGVNL